MYSYDFESRILLLTLKFRAGLLNSRWKNRVFLMITCSIIFLRLKMCYARSYYKFVALDHLKSSFRTICVIFIKALGKLF